MRLAIIQNLVVGRRAYITRFLSIIRWFVSIITRFVSIIRCLSPSRSRRVPVSTFRPFDLARDRDSRVFMVGETRLLKSTSILFFIFQSLVATPSIHMFFASSSECLSAVNLPNREYSTEYRVNCYDSCVILC